MLQRGKEVIWGTRARTNDKDIGFDLEIVETNFLPTLALSC